MFQRLDPAAAIRRTAPTADGSRQIDRRHAYKTVTAQWNRLGTRLLPKMRGAGTVTATIRLEIKLDESKAPALSTELRQIVDENGLSATLRVEQRPGD